MELLIINLKRYQLKWKANLSNKKIMMEIIQKMVKMISLKKLRKRWSKLRGSLSKHNAVCFMKILNSYKKRKQLQNRD